MAQDVAPIERLAEQPIALDPRAIEEAFTRIWQETTGAGYNAATIRLRVGNLVAIARRAGDVGRFEQVMQVLPERHPCRGLLALAEPGREQLETSISAHCWRSPGERRHVCSEEVTLRGGSSHEAEMASAVLALLVPEVPVDVWHIGEFTPDSYLVHEVLDEADRLFFDSREQPDIRAAARTALELSEAHDIALVDLAWCRLETWRALTAQLFDGDDGARELDQIRTIEIRGGDGAPSAEAMLLTGWLVSRLGYSLRDAGPEGSGVAATLYDGTRGVQLTVHAGSGEGELDAVRIRTDDAQFIVECHAESGHMHIVENWEGGATRRTMEQEADDEPSVIARALAGTGDAPIYDEALRAALAIIG